VALILAFVISKSWESALFQNPRLLESKAAKIIQAGLSMFQVLFQYSGEVETPLA
jgi:hypothetical protein